MSASVEERLRAASEMTAAVRDRYGVDALELRQIARPELTDDGVLVRVRASSVNRREWYEIATPFSDVSGSRPWKESTRVLKPDGIFVQAGAPTRGPLGPFGYVARTRVAALRGRRRLAAYITRMNRPDLEVLRELIEDGKVTPVVERRYELGEVADAVRYLGGGHCRAKVVVTI